MIVDNGNVGDENGNILSNENVEVVNGNIGGGE